MPFSFTTADMPACTADPDRTAPDRSRQGFPGMKNVRGQSATKKGSPAERLLSEIRMVGKITFQ